MTHPAKMVNAKQAGRKQTARKNKTERKTHDLQQDAVSY